MSKKLKYNNWAELYIAFQSGELDENNPEHLMHMDNDECYIYIDDICVFRAGGPQDICEVLELAGIPSKWV